MAIRVRCICVPHVIHFRHPTNFRALSQSTIPRCYADRSALIGADRRHRPPSRYARHLSRNRSPSGKRSYRLQEGGPPAAVSLVIKLGAWYPTRAATGTARSGGLPTNGFSGIQAASADVHRYYSLKECRHLGRSYVVEAQSMEGKL